MPEDLIAPAGSATAPVLEIDRVGVAEAVDALDDVAAVWAAPDEPTVIAVGRARVLTATGEDRLASIRAEADQLFETLGEYPRIARPRLFGGVSFFDAERLAPPWSAFDPAAFVLPAQQVVIDEDRTVLAGIDVGRAALEATATTLQQAPEERGATEREGETGTRAGPVTLRTEPETWRSRVATVTERIQRGDLEKAVLAAAADLPLESELDLESVLGALGARYPECYRFAFNAGGAADAAATFFGASPERLVGKRGQRVETEALAGTVRRGETEVADRERIRHLDTDETIAAEHAVVATRIRDQLANLGAEVRAGDRSVHSLANVHHLRTPITATLSEPAHVLDLVTLLHPTPALGGHPADAARELIEEVEPTARGWYGAPVGWFDAAGDGTFAVGIRSAVAQDGVATLFAGNGIVAGSDPETEFRELDAKFDPIREVL